MFQLINLSYNNFSRKHFKICISLVRLHVHSRNPTLSYCKLFLSGIPHCGGYQYHWSSSFHDKIRTMLKLHVLLWNQLSSFVSTSMLCNTCESWSSDLILRSRKCENVLKTLNVKSNHIVHAFLMVDMCDDFVENSLNLSRNFFINSQSNERWSRTFVVKNYRWDWGLLTLGCKEKEEL